jgi:hypothetical protein
MLNQDRNYRFVCQILNNHSIWPRIPQYSSSRKFCLDRGRHVTHEVFDGNDNPKVQRLTLTMAMNIKVETNLLTGVFPPGRVKCYHYIHLSLVFESGSSLVVVMVTANGFASSAFRFTSTCHWLTAYVSANKIRAMWKTMRGLWSVARNMSLRNFLQNEGPSAIRE